MTVEIVNKVEDLNPNYPETNSAVGKGDDHLRNIKYGLIMTFTGASSTGVTGFNVVTQPPGTNSTLASSCAFVSVAIAAAAFSTALPSQPGNAGKYVTTNGTTASWSALPVYITDSSFRTFQSNWGGINANNP